jgi:hypothetical protein
MNCWVSTNPVVDRTTTHLYCPSRNYFFAGTYEGNAGTWVVSRSRLPVFVPGGYDTTRVGMPWNRRDSQLGYKYRDHNGDTVEEEARPIGPKEQEI